jgi:colicin import membrane protein
VRIIRENPRAFGLALLVHLVLLAVLVFSLDWAPEVKPTSAQKQAPVQAIAVDGARLDAELERKRQLQEQQRREAEQAAQRKLEAERRRKAELAAQKQAEVERKQQAELEAKRKAEAERKREVEQEARRKAELEAQKRAEAERKRKAAEQEAKRKAELEAKKRAEVERKRKAEEARRKAELEAKKQAEFERKRKAEEAARRKAEAELQARLAAEQERMAAQRRSAMQRMVDEYVQHIRAKVQRSWIRPPATGSNLACTVTVRLIPSGDVVDVGVVRSSGNQVFDQSVKNAVLKASPLPMPPDPEVMEQFRTISFEFRPDN